MAFNNNQGFPRPNQFQQNQNFLQQQQLANIRLGGNGNISPGAQNVFSTLQATGAAGGLPWGAGLAVQAGQHAMQPQTMPAGFQNMANQQQQQQNAANLMGMFANQQMLAQAAGNQQLLAQMAGNQQFLTQASGNQQLLAQAAGYMGNPGLGLQMPIGGAGILGAGPVGQMMPNIGLGNGGQFSPMGANQMQNNASRSRDNRSASRDRKYDKFDKSRGDSKDNRDFGRDKNRRDDNSRSSDRKDVRSDDRNSDRKDRGDSKSRRVERVPKDEYKRGGSAGDKRDERTGDRRRDERRDAGRKDDQRKSSRGDNRDNRSRDMSARSRDQDSRTRRDRDQKSPDRKRQRRTQDDGSDTSRRAPNEDPLMSESDELEDWFKEDIPSWIRCSPSDLYFSRDSKTGCLKATKRMKELEDKFEQDLVLRADRVKESRPPVNMPERKHKPHVHCHHHKEKKDGSSSSSSSCSSSDDSDDEGDDWMEELNRKKNHPYRLHEELWYNDPGEMNDGPLCRCSIKSRKTGIRHNIYPGEKAIEACDPESNNSNRLYHYRITMSPPTNFLTKCPSVIEYDNHEYIFEGFSLFSHSKLENVPMCRVIRFNIEYSIHIIEEELLQNFTVRSLDLFTRFLFTEILELVDLDWKGPGGPEHCNRFHLMPRFSRSCPENGKEVLSMNEVMSYLIRNSKPLIKESKLPNAQAYDAAEWQSVVDEVRGMVVTRPGMKPCSLRIDQLDRSDMEDEDKEISYPQIIHFGIRPAQLSYAGDPTYQKLWKQFVKFKHLLNSKPKILYVDKQKLQQKETALNELRLKNTMKREVTVEIDCKGFVRTGIKSDITQHTMLIPVLLDHLRFHNALDRLEADMQYKFQDRGLLQLALTHTSFKVKYGTNTDHARNSLSNCGMRQLEYGDRKIHFQHTRKRGINILINIMSRLGNKEEVLSEIPHNERLEFLGDAVVEFISSVHLFFMFPWLEEGGLTSYRTALVQNQHLAILAKHLHLDEYMLYAHGPDLCHESDLKHAMANCFEALLGALFLDGGIEVADRIYGQTLFYDSNPLLQTWKELPLHPLQEDEPNGDRHWIKSSPALQKLISFEESIGIEFDHVRLLARAFTLRSVGCNNLTLGHNQRLEFLGDTVLQLVASEYLFKHFPDHHEGHLSLLRSSLVNNRTQSIVSDDLGMSEHIIHAETRGETLDMKTKEKADLLEAFMGALYVDKGIHYCRVFCHVCFFPRLQDFIRNQVWNDPKSQLQQCCLTLRDLDGGEPDIPIYKMIESIGPTNTRRYKVAVYFKGERLATGTGHSIQTAEMNAAFNSLKERSELFPILSHQKRFLERKYKKFTADQKSMKLGRLSDGRNPGTSGLGKY